MTLTTGVRATWRKDSVPDSLPKNRVPEELPAKIEKPSPKDVAAAIRTAAGANDVPTFADRCGDAGAPCRTAPEEPKRVKAVVTGTRTPHREVLRGDRRAGRAGSGPG